MVLKAEFLLSNSASPSEMMVTVTGEFKVVNPTVPIVSGMEIGLLASGDVIISIDYPHSSTWKVDLSAKTESETEVALQVTADLGKSSPLSNLKTVVSRTLDADSWDIMKQIVFGPLSSMGTVLDHFSFKLPFTAGDIVSGFDKITGGALPHLLTPSKNPFSVTIQALKSTVSPMVLNVSYNTEDSPMSCLLDFSDSSTLSDCGLDEFFSISLTTGSFPKISLNQLTPLGLIHTIVFSPALWENVAIFPPVYQTSITAKPIFTTWNDLAVIMHQQFGLPLVEIEYDEVPMDQMAHLFPANSLAVQFATSSIDAKVTAFAINYTWGEHLSLPINSSIEIPAVNFELLLQNPAALDLTITFDLYAQIAVVHDLPPANDGKGLFVSTAFSSVNASDVTVYAGSKFTLVLDGERWFENGTFAAVDTLTVNVTLASGATNVSLFLGINASLTNTDYFGMIDVVYEDADRVLGTVQQVRLQCVPKIMGSGSVIFPTAIAVRNAFVTGRVGSQNVTILSNASNKLNRDRIVVSQFSLGVDIDSSISGTE